MKKLIFIWILALTLVSCEKYYTDIDFSGVYEGRVEGMTNVIGYPFSTFEALVADNTIASFEVIYGGGSISAFKVNNIKIYNLDFDKTIRRGAQSIRLEGTLLPHNLSMSGTWTSTWDYSNIVEQGTFSGRIH